MQKKEAEAEAKIAVLERREHYFRAIGAAIAPSIGQKVDKAMSGEIGRTWQKTFERPSKMSGHDVAEALRRRGFEQQTSEWTTSKESFDISLDPAEKEKAAAAREKLRDLQDKSIGCGLPPLMGFKNCESTKQKSARPAQQRSAKRTLGNC